MPSEEVENIINDPFNKDLHIKKLRELQNKTIEAQWKLPIIFKDLAISSLIYLFLIYVFLNLYDRWGFEKTLIIVLVGVVSFAIRKK